MVTVILGIIAAIAAPRVLNAGKQATMSAIQESVVAVRRAIDLFAAEHGMYPGFDPETGEPDGRWFVKQLVQYSDASGNVRGKYRPPHIYGPYLREPFPVNPFNQLATVVMLRLPGDPLPRKRDCGWIAVLTTGDFWINADAQDFTERGLDGGSGDLDVFKK